MTNQRRVVITGLGIKSSIGNTKAEVIDSLRHARSGIEYSEEYAQLGLRSHVHGPIRLDLNELIDRKQKRFMGDASAFAYLAMQDAVTDSGLDPAMVSNPRTGLIAGSGGASTANTVIAVDTLRERGAKKVGPMMVPRIMSSTVSACLSVAYGIKGVSYSISSACTTSLHCIGNAMELIQSGKQDIVFAGGGDEVHWTMAMLFDSMGALSSSYNDTPTTASRPFDASRDGFVISGGGGIVVAEELEHAQARGAKIYGELIGYGATCDGSDMVKPSGEGAMRCMRLALATAGDGSELRAIREVFGATIPRISATKALSGHGLGAAGVNEIIFSLLMLERDFICPSANIVEVDAEGKDLPIVRKCMDNAGLRTVMSNSFGFGGTNGTLVIRRI